MNEWKVAISPTREALENTTPDQVALDMLTIEFTIGERVKETAEQIVRGVIADLHLTGKVDYTLVPASRSFTMPCPHSGCEYVGLPTSLAVHYQRSHMNEEEPHDHPGLLSGRGVDHVHKGGTRHRSN